MRSWRRPRELRELSRILTKHAKDLRENAEDARERSRRLREIAGRAKLSGDTKHAHAKAARERQDER
jgi:hypothetical protein